MSNALESERSMETRYDRSIKGFAEVHGLHPHFIPVPRRVCDEWELFDRLKGEVHDLRPTQQSFKISDMLEKGHGQDSALVGTFLWALGSYPVEPEVSESLWANPHYCHGDEHQNPVHDRDQHIKRAVETAAFKLEDIAARFGVKPGSMSRYCRRNDLSFAERWRVGRDRIGRTIKTTAAWSDYTIKDCARIYPVAGPTVEDWGYRRVSEYSPPEMPMNSNWTADPKHR